MLLMVFRKMLYNKWLVLCLLIGSILSVAMVSTIPMYTDAVLQRMLIRDLENSQTQSSYFPGRYYVSTSTMFSYNRGNNVGVYNRIDQKVTEEMAKEIDLPILTKTRHLVIDYLSALPAIQREEEPKKRSIQLETLEGMEEHIDIVHGRMFSQEETEGIYEVMVTEQAMQQMDLRLDEVYEAKDFTNQNNQTIRLKVVGVFTMKDTKDPYWFQGLWAYNQSFLMDYALFNKDFLKPETDMITKVQWYYGFDYHQVTLEKLDNILEACEEQTRWFADNKLEFRMPALEVFEQYLEREKQLKTTLWVLQVPILLMLVFYIFMVSQLIIQHDKNEIAVCKSRGASNLQIFYRYLVESVLLSIIALIFGPPLGLLLCTLLGAANGFLEFTQRTALPVFLSSKVYLYALGAVLVSIVTMLIPAYLSSRTTIVQHKRKKSKNKGKFQWGRLGVELMLLGIAGYGLFTYQMRQEALSATGASGTELAIDPLLFIISTAFILGMGLLFLRIYPYVIRLIFHIGRKYWSPVFYASFLQVGRSEAQDQFVMLFIILTISIGIFNANGARTLNNNIEEKIRYANGADIRIEPHWENNQPPEQTSINSYGMEENDVTTTSEPIQYREPPFMPYENLEEVEGVTKVFVQDEVVVQTPVREYVGKVSLMGIIPKEFGEIAWFRNDLLQAHWYQYLNLMSMEDPRAALVSRSFQEKYDIKKGDSLWVNWGEQGYMEVVVYEFVDYWPTFNPNSEGKGERYLVVANLSYIQSQTALEPYEIWLKKKPGASSEEIYNDIQKKELEIEKLTDIGQQMIVKKNDPMLQGTNGVLTLGFIVTMLISTIGFLIYWILSIQQRVLQFGIFRAMGFSAGQLFALLINEQILVSGVAILAGIMIGGLTSDLFVPLLQLVYSAAQQVPPFRVLKAREDYIRIYTIVTAMLTTGLLILGAITSKIKIYQAIKLGED